MCSRRERKIKAANVGPQAAFGRRTAARLAQLEERRSAKREAVSSDFSRTTSGALKSGEIMRTVMKTDVK